MRELLKQLLTYWETGYVWRKCALCNKHPYKLPKGTTPFTKVKVYCWPCLEKLHGVKK